MTERPDFPIVNWEKLHEGGWKIPFYRMGVSLVDRYNTDPSERTGFFSKALGGYLDTQKRLWTQEARTRYQNTFPFIAAHQGFSSGPTEIDRLYTVEVSDETGTHELPVYVKEEGDTLPSRDLLGKNISYAVEERESPYNRKGVMSAFYKGDFSGKAAEKYTRGDIKDSHLFPEPDRLKRWLCMDDAYRLQQRGELYNEDDFSIDGISYKVRVYKRPEKERWDSWLYWAFGDKLYDLIDAPFDAIQKRLGGFSPDFAYELTKNEYKTVAAIRRSFFRNKNRLPLSFDLTKGKDKKKKDKAPTISEAIADIKELYSDDVTPAAA